MKIFYMVILSVLGLGFLFTFDWQVALGVFLLMWGNNLMLKD